MAADCWLLAEQGEEKNSPSLTNLMEENNKSALSLLQKSKEHAMVLYFFVYCI